MTWQLASFVILGLALTAGFAWYERSRPASRVLALVAALAALAVVGRLAFAAFPNVKPTTDIILLAGYALGAPAGFAVGAITPVVSNIFLGHGPWTPWQMVAWGGVGIGGALLARATRGRELGRWPLALACGAAGAAFGAVMDTYQWTLAAEQDLRTWLAVSASSLPYNIAHVLGNVAFALVIGPVFLRALARYRRRFAVRWAPIAAGAGVIVLLVAPAGASASAASRAAAWLSAAQNRDGGFGSAPGQASGALFTGWAALGLSAGGQNPRDVERRGHSAIDFIRGDAGTIRDVGEVERTILVLRAAGLSPRSFAGRDLIARLKRYRREDGSFSGFVSYTAFGVLALRSAGAGPVGGSARWLVRKQNADGGWGVAPGAQSDVDNSGAVLQALAAAGRGGSASADAAVNYLRGAQNADGGFGQTEGRTSNAQSTAYAVLGLAAAGHDPARMRRGGRSPLGYLRALQRADGRVNYSRVSSQTPVWVTAQALMAFRRKPLPIAPVDRASTAGASRASAAAGGGSPAAATDTPAAAGRRAHKKTHRPGPRHAPAHGPARLEPAATQPGTKRAGDAAESPHDPGPAWLGVVVSLVAAALAALAGRAWRTQSRRASAPKVTKKSSATAA